MSTSELPFKWSSIALPAFLPAFLFSTGEGAILPLIPTVAHSLGATLAISGLIAAMIMVGEVIGDIPSGWLVARIGERRGMIGGALVAMIGLGIATFAPNPLVLGIGITLIGLATAVFALARHAFMTSFIPANYRARALSTLGGVFRAGYFVGPFIAAGVIALTNHTGSVFWIGVVGCLSAAIVLLIVKDPTETLSSLRSESAEAKGVAGAPKPLDAGQEELAKESTGLFQTVRANGAVLARVGIGVALLSAIRSSRAVILPLWAVSIGVSDSNTALIIGLAGAIDFALFYTSGQIMDRWGRLASILPCILGLGITHLLLSISLGFGDRTVWFITIALVMALANGTGSGIILTIGADLAPKSNPAPFLGAWRFISDSGSALAPVVISVLTGLISIAFATGFIGVVGLVGGVILWRYVPRYIPRPKRAAAKTAS